MSEDTFECSNCGKEVKESRVIGCDLCNDGCEHGYCSMKCMDAMLSKAQARADWYEELQLERGL